jgi:hypothetical protein
MKDIIRFFDKFEDKVRGVLSHKPIIYAIVGGASHVLFWRGVWHLADDYNMSSWASLLIGAGVLMATGLIVAAFIGDQIIISGIRHEKKVTEKTEEEVKGEAGTLSMVHTELHKISERLEAIEKKMGKE